MKGAGEKDERIVSGGTGAVMRDVAGTIVRDGLLLDGGPDAVRGESTAMRVNVVGAGLAGLSAAIALAETGVPCNLISLQASERAQSVLAAGGINGAINTMGEDDNVGNHMADTLKAGVFIADPEAVEGLTSHAPEIIYMLSRFGVPFNMDGGRILCRNFGGQKKKRTAFSKSSTGKTIMSALIDEARKYEAAGLIRRFPHHEFLQLVLEMDGRADESCVERVCRGVVVRDVYAPDGNGMLVFEGPVILAGGGMNGMFPELTTGTTANSGDLAALVFAQGVRFSNLEMIQYHPTTMGISGKRCLVSEAARGEGGRLYIERNGTPWYFMEEKYPELGNLMPRDVVAREMYFVLRDPECGNQVYLDMRHFDEEIWRKKLSDLRSEILHYKALDPRTEPIPVDPSIHYFMGGIDVDVRHETNVRGLFAAGECCSQYHGANRLGGNSMLGAVYGGRVAARGAAERLHERGTVAAGQGGGEERAAMSAAGRGGADARGGGGAALAAQTAAKTAAEAAQAASPARAAELRDALAGALGIVRRGDVLAAALARLAALADGGLNPRERARLQLAQAMLLSAQARKESRGAHYREDYPEKDDAYRGLMTAELRGGGIEIAFRPVEGRHETTA